MVMLFVILFSTNSPTASTIFWVVFFETLLKAATADNFVWLTFLLLIFTTYVFTNIFREKKTIIFDLP